MEKQIHVNSYVKRDGTIVKEHFRTIDTDNLGLHPDMSQVNAAPIGNISDKTIVIENPDVDSASNSVPKTIDDVLGNIGRTVLKSLPLVLQLIQALHNGKKETANNLIPQFNTQMRQFDTHIGQMKSSINNIAAKLATVKNQSEYSKLYQTLQKVYPKYQRAVALNNKIQAHANAGNYENIANELENNALNWDKDGRVFYTDKDNKPIAMKKNNRLKNQLKAFGTNAKNWINETNPDSETYKQKTYLASLAASAPLSLGSSATMKIGQSLTPLLGRKIAQLTAQGISGGLASGASSGFARGLIYDKNPLLTSLQDAIILASFGGLSNYGLGYIQRIIAQYQIYKSPLKEILINNYIKNYLEGLKNFRKEIDNIRAMKLGVKPFGGKKGILYNTEPLKYTGKYVRIDGKTYKEIWLPQDEYAPVEHAMSDLAKQGNLKNVIIDITMPYEPNYVYYYYKAIIDKNGTPTIIYKEINYD